MKKMNTNMFRTLALALMMMLGTAAAFAQMTVQGEVIDASNGEPIIGASIFEIGTTNGTVTDFDGQFVLKVHNGAKARHLLYGIQKAGTRSTACDEGTGSARMPRCWTRSL